MFRYNSIFDIYDICYRLTLSCLDRAKDGKIQVCPLICPSIGQSQCFSSSPAAAAEPATLPSRAAFRSSVRVFRGQSLSRTGDKSFEDKVFRARSRCLSSGIVSKISQCLSSGIPAVHDDCSQLPRLRRCRLKTERMEAEETRRGGAEKTGQLAYGAPKSRPSKPFRTGENARSTEANWVRKRQVGGPRKSADMGRRGQAIDRKWRTIGTDQATMPASRTKIMTGAAGVESSAGA